MNREKPVHNSVRKVENGGKRHCKERNKETLKNSFFNTGYILYLLLKEASFMVECLRVSAKEKDVLINSIELCIS